MFLRRLHLWPAVAVLALVLAVFAALPGVASADDSLSASAQGTGPEQSTFAIPGILSLTLGQGFTYSNDTITLDSATVAIPAINATGTVQGLTLGPNMRLQGWDSVAIAQAQPLVGQTYSVSGAQLAIAGPSTGYSGLLSANLDLHPSEAFQLSGTFGVSYNGLARALGVGMSEANVTVNAGALNLMLTGANTGAGTLSVGSAEAAIAATGTSLAVTGLQSGPRGLDWDTLDLKQAPISFGNALTVAPMQLRIGGSATGYSTAGLIGLDLNLGNVAAAHGELVTVVDRTTNQTQFALQNAGATVAVPGWTLALDGIDTGPGGTSMDSFMVQATQLGLTAEVNGLAMTETGQFVFDDATIQYAPQTSATGFEMQITRTDAGYVMTTTTMLPARRGQ
jgi:hypothetical protein